MKDENVSVHLRNNKKQQKICILKDDRLCMRQIPPSENTSSQGEYVYQFDLLKRKKINLICHKHVIQLNRTLM